MFLVEQVARQKNKYVRSHFFIFAKIPKNSCSPLRIGLNVLGNCRNKDYLFVLPLACYQQIEIGELQVEPFT